MAITDLPDLRGGYNNYIECKCMIRVIDLSDLRGGYNERFYEIYGEIGN